MACRQLWLQEIGVSMAEITAWDCIMFCQGHPLDNIDTEETGLNRDETSDGDHSMVQCQTYQSAVH